MQLLCSMLQSEAHVQHRSTSFNIVQHRRTWSRGWSSSAWSVRLSQSAKMCEGWEVTGRYGKPWAKDVAETTPVEMDSGPGR